MATYIDKQFGLSFNVSGLGGLVNCGKTGFGAGMSHSPQFPCDVNGVPRERCESSRTFQKHVEARVEHRRHSFTERSLFSW